MANTRITQGVIKPNEDYDVRHINATGIITAPSVNVTGVLTYEDVTNVDSVGLITARKGIISSGVVTATAFHGSGANLTGIDATALKDSGGNVKVQAQSSGAVHTGISTFDTINVGSGVTIESNGRATFTGIVTFGSNSTTIGDNVINVGTALTLGHTQGVQFHTQNLHSQGFEVNQINASGIITASSFSGDGSNLTSLPAGLGTALSSVQSSPLNKIYYTNSVLGIDNNTTIDVPASASAAYTQYTDINIASGVDLIISDGDDLIPDVLGLRPDGTYGGGSIGRIRVDKLVGKDANSAINVEKGLIISGVTSTTSAFQVNGATSLANTNQATFDYNSSQTRILSHNSSGSSIAFFTNSGGSNVTQKLVIDSSGRMLLGTSNANHYPDRMLTINRDAGSGIELRNNSSSTGQISFSDTNGSGTGAYRGYIQFQHNNGSMHFATQSTERLVLTREGNANFSGIATATAFVPTTGQLSHRNLINNGQFLIWQRATDSGSNTTDGYLSCDRWYHASSGATKQVTRQTFAPGQTDVPDNPKYYLRYAVTTGNNNVALRQRIEDVTRCQGEMTLSFWVKGSNPGGGQFALIFRQNFGTGGGGVSNVVDQGIANYTVSNTWTKKTFTFTPTSISGKTLGNAENSSYYEIELFRQPAGDTSTAAFTVDFANVQLERGPVATPFEQLSYGEELRNCERYFQCMKGYSITSTGDSEALYGIAFAYTTSRTLWSFQFKTEMRTNPTVSMSNLSYLQGLGVVGGWNAASSFVNTVKFSKFGGRVDLNWSGTPFTAGHAVEMRIINDGLLGFDAEL